MSMLHNKNTRLFYVVNICLIASFACLLSPAFMANANEQKLAPWQLAQQTEVWEPVPSIVSLDKGGMPSDAIPLFDGNSLDKWVSLKGEANPWSLKNGEMIVKPGTGDIKTKQTFCDVQLHLEWKTPTKVEDMEGQQRNNSGIFFQQRYEIQILDSFDNKTYPNGQAASVYKQTIPLVNAMLPPGQWQTYDIIFNAPTFKGSELEKPAYITVIHNGVIVQNHVEIQGKTEWIGPPSYEPHGCEPFQLQDHGNLVSFRNIWVRKL